MNIDSLFNLSGKVAIVTGVEMALEKEVAKHSRTSELP